MRIRRIFLLVHSVATALAAQLSAQKLAVVVVALSWVSTAHISAQETGRTVADGVYTEAQAIRGAAAYNTFCSGCHRADLGGADGPALREDRFAKTFAEKDLRTLYTKIATTMPRGAPASLGDDVYLDVIAHVLRENGFPAGAQELTGDRVAGVRILPGRPKPPPPVGDFSYVEVVGCLMPGPGNTWMLTNASEPVSVLLTGSSANPPADLNNKALGSQSFRLLDAMAYSPESHKGHKMYVRGLLIKLPAELRMTISSLDMVAPSCGN
jgi:mono/diheme cytochrome c family protein